MVSLSLDRPSSDGKANLQAKVSIAAKAHIGNYNTRLYYQSLNKTVDGLNSIHSKRK
jgi:L-asparaginase/Glu-tRNA(Gln) amidotransferase subunit D